MSTRTALILLFALASLTVTAQTPPQNVDAALRARAQEFFQLEIDHKFRQAESLVAEESKDYFYESKKPDLKEFSLKSIDYGSDFKTAHITATVKMTFFMPVAAKPMLVTIGYPSDWKLVDGQWYWFFDSTKPLETAFGKSNAGPSTGGGSTPEFSIPAIPSNPLEIDPTSAQLDAAHPQPATITLKNALPGPITIQLVTRSPSLKVEISRPNLAASESATLTVAPVPGQPDRPNQLTLRIGPLGQLIQIQLNWVAPGK